MKHESFEDKLRRLTPREPAPGVRERVFRTASVEPVAEVVRILWRRLPVPAACMLLIGLTMLRQLEQPGVTLGTDDRFHVGFIRLAPWSEPTFIPGVDVVRRNAIRPTFASTNLMGTTSSRGFSEMLATEFVTR